MIGRGIPNNHNSAPLPNPMAILRLFFKRTIRLTLKSSEPPSCIHLKRHSALRQAALRSRTFTDKRSKIASQRDRSASERARQGATAADAFSVHIGVFAACLGLRQCAKEASRYATRSSSGGRRYEPPSRNTGSTLIKKYRWFMKRTPTPLFWLLGRAKTSSR
jgi:hypothetical protein